MRDQKAPKIHEALNIQEGPNIHKTLNMHEAPGGTKYKRHLIFIRH